MLDDTKTAEAVTLAAYIEQIGKELVACNRPCADVERDRANGHIPHCLFLDVDRRKNARGAAVVGLNPGSSKEADLVYYRQRSYEAVMNWFRERALCDRYYPNYTRRPYPYYKRLRELVDALGLKGPILWTELAKCENARNVSELSLQTFRTCTGAFLQRRLEQLPKDWPLLGVGREAYKALAYRFPTRTVLGIPHPTGSHGLFSALFENDVLCKAVATKARAVISRKGQALWLKSSMQTSNGGD